MSTSKPDTIPPLVHSEVGPVDIVCCISCCPVNWFTRAKTPQIQSPAGFNPKLEPVARAIVEEVHRARAESNASRRPSLVAAVTGVVEDKKDPVVAKTEAVATTFIRAGRGGN